MMAEQRPLQLIHPRPPDETRRVAPSQVLGTGIFIMTEVMFFAGLISAFALVKAGAPGGIWPPPPFGVLHCPGCLFRRVQAEFLWHCS